MEEETHWMELCGLILLGSLVGASLLIGLTELLGGM